MRWIVALAATAAFTPLAAAQTAASKIAPAKGWHVSLDKARAESRSTGKPLMVVFRCDP